MDADKKNIPTGGKKNAILLEIDATILFHLRESASIYG
jgi:hypothetical protein